ncbi:GNAT family acetyltransferase [Vibrio cholerae]|nr:GNAT family acetyltransferase [Vibrio cholerae]GHZ43795.1 GNAT family acetyltransferase [Vibrio cholerae]
MPQGETVVQGFEISTDNNRLNFEVIYEFISQSYWAADIPKATLEKAYPPHDPTGRYC